MWYISVLPKWVSIGFLGVSSLLLLGYTTSKLCPYFGKKKNTGGIVMLEK